ncbi:MAG TPA: hypothetical protein VKX17_27845 [Planctomycetota bacterium]|nr:hypothetical protein [Planctomycetota bacterium]
MTDKLAALLAKIKVLEHELLAEIQKKQTQFGYTIREKKVRFTAVVKAHNKKLAMKWARYIHESTFFSLLSAPVIWSCLFPVLLMDVVCTFYQFFCFPIYGIPKVRRADYIVIDRHKLGYLNFFERLNCAYCGYVNGFLAYATEIAGRTEQYWCPIKHALHLKTTHSRYQKFFDYGDAEQYHQRLEQMRQDFEDLKKETDGQ